MAGARGDGTISPREIINLRGMWGGGSGGSASAKPLHAGGLEAGVGSNPLDHENVIGLMGASLYCGDCG